MHSVDYPEISRSRLILLMLEQRRLILPSPEKIKKNKKFLFFFFFRSLPLFSHFSSSLCHYSLSQAFQIQSR